MHQEVIFEEHAVQKASLATIKNSCGNITIKTDPLQEKIFLKVVKRAYEKEDLAKLAFSYTLNGQEVILESKFDAQLIDGALDFELIVPQKLALNVQACDGDIKIGQSHAPVRVTTQKGSIEVVNAYGTVDANSQQKGSITLHNPQRNIKAYAHNGAITIHDAKSSVVATTEYGSIELFAKEVPSTSSIKLASNSGSIVLHLPPDVNADLQASTKYGMITSDHYITLKPHTTQLNRSAWKRLQREIEGTLGSGEAQITLSSVKSDIKLVEVKA